MNTILHIDFNSYFATVEQQANPRLRGKPIGVTGGPARNASASVAGGDRMKRTVIGAASVEAKKYGVKTGMAIWQAQRLCPQIILVRGDSDKYLETTKRFLNILKDYSPDLEVFSIDECFLQLTIDKGQLKIAKEIKQRIKQEIGEYITCSIGISYNKLLAKLAGSLKKPDGLVVIPNQEEAIKILDKIELDEICGIGRQIKKRLFNLGITDFKKLREVPLELLLASFKSYGQVLYNMARGLDYSPIVPFFEKKEVKSIGHRHTISHDTSDPLEIKQVFLKLTELIARRLRVKNLVGKTVSCWIRYGLHTVIPAKAGIYTNNSLWIPDQVGDDAKRHFQGEGMQSTIVYTSDGLEVFKAAWKIFSQVWNEESIRMIGVSISNLKPEKPQNLSLLEDIQRQDKIIQALDKINNKYGEFTLQRGILLGTPQMKRTPNPFLSDRRFKL